MIEAAMLVTGLLSGAAVAWLAARAHFEGLARADRVALETRLAGVETLEKELQRQLAERQLEVNDLRASLDGARTERARAEERWVAERQNLGEQRRMLDEARQRLTDTFRALSADTLAQTSGAFLDRARETLDAQLGRREQAMEMLLQPLQDALRRSEQQVRELENARQHAYGTLDERLRALTDQSRELQREAGNLAAALRTSQTRGRWGEIALRRLVELAGMTAHCDFSEQVSHEAEGVRVRPDMVVHLPGGRDIIIDAKAPLDAYDEALRAATEDDRRRALLRHAQQVRGHVMQLSGKAYWKQLEHSPDLVVMFIPGESFVAAAAEADGRLLSDAMERRVVIATPTTLFALLSAIHHGWKQERAATNAREIHALGQELYERVSTLGTHFRKLGASLKTTVETFNLAVGSVESRVLPAARRFRDLGIVGGEEVAAVSPLEQQPRRLTAPELTEQLELAADAVTPGVSAAQVGDGPERAAGGPAGVNMGAEQRTKHGVDGGATVGTDSSNAREWGA